MACTDDVNVSAWIMPGQLSSKGTHYRLEGDKNGDCCCMIHGLGIYSYIFDKFAAFLQSKGMCTLRYDTLGMGFSMYPDEVQDPSAFWSGAGHVQQLFDLLEELNLLGKKIIIIGFSMGGGIGTLFTEKYPNLVKNLILLAPCGNSPVPVQLQLIRYLRYVTGSCFDGFILQLLQKDKLNVETKRNTMDFADPNSKEAYFNYEMVVTQHQNNDQAVLAVLNCLRVVNMITKGVQQQVVKTTLYFPFSDLYSQCANISMNIDCRLLLLWGINDKTVPFPTSRAAWERIAAASNRMCCYQHLDKEMLTSNMFIDRNAIQICSFSDANHMFLVEDGTETRIFHVVDEWLRE